MHNGSGLLQLALPLPFILFFVAVAVVAVLRVRSNRRRTEAVRAWATARGWSLFEADPDLARRWGGSPFGTGGSRRATEILSGPLGGRQVLSFRYSYTTSNGKSTTRHEHHVVAVFLPMLLPTLDVTPEGFGAKIVKAFGGQDIQFESEQFNSRWRVASPDPRFAHDVIHPRVMERLLQPDVSGMTIRFVGDAVLTWTTGVPRVETIDWRAWMLSQMIDSIPDYVWQDRQYPAR